MWSFAALRGSWQHLNVPPTGFSLRAKLQSAALCKPRTTDLRLCFGTLPFGGCSKHSSPHLRTGRFVVRGKQNGTNADDFAHRDQLLRSLKVQTVRQFSMVSSLPLLDSKRNLSNCTGATEESSFRFAGFTYPRVVKVGSLLPPRLCFGRQVR